MKPMKTMPPDQQSQNRFISHRKRHSFASFFKSAAKKTSGILAIFLFRRRKAASKSKPYDPGTTGHQNQNRAFSYSTDVSSASNSKSVSKLRSSFSYSSSSSSTVQSGQIKSSSFSFAEILRATDKFSEANVIGEGSFGTVYKGRLVDGSFVAVKRAKTNKQTSSEFKNEVATLSQIEHLNLVRLYGYLEHVDERIMVVEYVGNGTLREHLEGSRGNGLEISDRLDIAIDVAHAVTYLHTYTDPPIIHRDIKASNILITEKLRAKVADFGFARAATEDPTATHISTQVKGSMGYLDPEYLNTYQLSEKSDVYSFGVLLVEMVTGRHPIESKRPQNEKVTIKWAMQKLKAGDAVLTMDWKIRRSPASVMVTQKILKLARQCLAPSRQSRPSMRKCAEVLWRIRKEFKEIASSPLPSASSHHCSADFPIRDVRGQRETSFGIEDNENHRFVSA